VRYSAEQLFAVVAAIDEYPHFLPWCKEGRILTSDGNGGVTAELSVGFKGLSEKYTSAVEMTRPREIRVAALDSTLFEELSSEWEFRPGPDENSCWLQFRVSFAFRNPLYNQVPCGVLRHAGS
jgi:coenzyme Q-binding protein COQ10